MTIQKAPDEVPAGMIPVREAFDRFCAAYNPSYATIEAAANAARVLIRENPELQALQTAGWEQLRDEIEGTEKPAWAAAIAPIMNLEILRIEAARSFYQAMTDPDAPAVFIRVRTGAHIELPRTGWIPQEDHELLPLASNYLEDGGQQRHGPTSIWNEKWYPAFFDRKIFDTFLARLGKPNSNPAAAIPKSTLPIPDTEPASRAQAHAWRLLKRHRDWKNGPPRALTSQAIADDLNAIRGPGEPSVGADTIARLLKRRT